MAVFHRLLFAVPRRLIIASTLWGVFMKGYIPLLQSLLWVSVTLGAVFMFRQEIALVQQVFAERLEQRASLKFGPFELGEIRRDKER
jgi:hypothetical protein